ncbi:MAG TPA: hypothetical protein VKU85_06180, partial [bacterium]|nr:hypothetical protein [bacterium]
MSLRVRSSITPIVMTLLLAGFLVLPAPADAQVPTALIREGDAIPEAGAGHVVGGLNNTATNHVGGYAVAFSSSDGGSALSHIWGTAAGGAGAIMRTEGTFGSLVQTS